MGHGFWGCLSAAQHIHTTGRKLSPLGSDGSGLSNVLQTVLAKAKGKKKEGVGASVEKLLDKEVVKEYYQAMERDLTWPSTVHTARLTEVAKDALQKGDAREVAYAIERCALGRGTSRGRERQ